MERVRDASGAKWCSTKAEPPPAARANPRKSLLPCSSRGKESPGAPKQLRAQRQRARVGRCREALL